ncbi:hypothetical protein DPMN_071657 [Dreissena polymorpha]|uniref:Selenoprotein W n=1 Tax=Dreissena polymorpha TaxID=45954 RepID=A0A9D4BVY1_DREPO|nr:hypothetical protein DPMN_071657 [Dreissena polymorpha]
MSMEATPGTTGWFEVTVGDKLVHSKKGSDGYVDSDKKVDRIVAAIEAQLK